MGRRNAWGVSYTVSDSKVEDKPGFRYGNSMGTQKSTEFEASEMMVQYSFFENLVFRRSCTEPSFPMLQTQYSFEYPSSCHNEIQVCLPLYCLKQYMIPPKHSSYPCLSECISIIIPELKVG